MNLKTADQLFQSYHSFQVPDFPRRHFPPEHYHQVIDRLFAHAAGLLQKKDLGKSFEGRPIRLISAGNGATSVLLWSQMHGDESTATMAIADILNFLIASRNDEHVHELLSKLTIHFLPILNPDGAARTQRRTAQLIDMNRDALALVTPEARILKQLQNDLKPEFGFNLHDQELSTVGTTKEFTAVALLAPAFDAAKSDNEVRLRAKHLAALIGAVMEEFAPGKVARYDDTFEPRAFGDNMQRWGTSTVLIESGHAMNDPQKDSIRKLNFVGILSSLLSIVNDEHRKSNISLYDQLPFNGKKACDVIIRNVVADNGNVGQTRIDLGVSYQVDTHSEPMPRLVDLGDLSTYAGLKEIDAKGKSIPQKVLDLGQMFEWEKYFG